MDPITSLRPRLSPDLTPSSTTYQEFEPRYNLSALFENFTTTGPTWSTINLILETPVLDFFHIENFKGTTIVMHPSTSGHE